MELIKSITETNRRRQDLYRDANAIIDGTEVRGVPALLILHAIVVGSGSSTKTEIHEATGVAQSHVVVNIRALEGSGFISCERKGKSFRYSAIQKGVAFIENLSK